MNIGISNVVSNPIIIALLPLAIISIIIWFSSSQRNKRIKKIENALPDMLSDLTETLKSGIAVETALKDISETRKDALGDEMKLLLKDMKEYSFSESLTRFARRTNSKTVSRVVSIINLSMTTNAELTDVLRKISEELWSGYMLDIEKETKTKSSASMILFGGILLTPLLMGGIFSIFGTAFAQEQFQMIVYYVGVFILVLAVCVCIMYGIVIGRLKQSIILIAPSMFIAYALYILVSTSKLM
jgi:hypothetical protein